MIVKVVKYCSFCCFQVPSREELRLHLFPIALQSELQNDKRSDISSCGEPAARRMGHVQPNSTDDSILNTSISSLSESGYDGDMEDEGDINVDDSLLDEELCNELADGEHGVLNKQSKDSSFLNWDEFSRTSSTPSILHGGFGFEVQDMATDSEPVPIDNVIRNASELCVPVAMEADDAMELGESCSKPVASTLRRRQPLRALENSDISDRASKSWKSRQRNSAWSRTFPSQ